MEGSRSTSKLQSGTVWLSLGVLMIAVCYWVLIRNRNHDPFEPTVKFPDSVPKQGGPPGYATSAACKECHPKQFETWWRSYHRQMTQVMNSNTVQAKFDGVMMYSGGARFTLHESSNRYWVDIQGIEELEAAKLTNGPQPIPNRIAME